MPRVVISFAESALRDLEDVQAWYVEQVVPKFDQPFLRELIHPPFRTVYRRDSQRVRIVRVWRSERLLLIPTADDEAPSKT